MKQVVYTVSRLQRPAFRCGSKRFASSLTTQQPTFKNKPTWKDLGLPPWICHKLEQMRYTPTNIQISALKALGYDHQSKPEQLGDSIIHDLTGTGKSLAYLLPVLLAVDNYQPHLQAIIVTPTRELATQIGKTAEQLISNPGKYRRRSPLIVRTLVGQLNPRMIDSLRATTPHVIIGTPGLLHQLLVDKHYYRYHRLSIERVRMLVMDEVDSLLGPYFAASVPLLRLFRSGKHPMLSSSSPSTSINSNATHLLETGEAYAIPTPGSWERESTFEGNEGGMGHDSLDDMQTELSAHDKAEMDAALFRVEQAILQVEEKENNQVTISDEETSSSISLSETEKSQSPWLRAEQKITQVEQGLGLTKEASVTTTNSTMSVAAVERSLMLEFGDLGQLQIDEEKGIQDILVPNEVVFVSASISSDILRLASAYLYDPKMLFPALKINKKHHTTKSILASGLSSALSNDETNIAEGSVAQAALAGVPLRIPDSIKHLVVGTDGRFEFRSKSLVKLLLAIAWHQCKIVQGQPKPFLKKGAKRYSTLVFFDRWYPFLLEMMDELKRRGLKVVCLTEHSRRSERREAMKPNTDIIFATDVMARGLDLPHISHVVNFTLPRAGSYVHRAGRVGRLGMLDALNKNANIVVNLCSSVEEEKLTKMASAIEFTTKKVLVYDYRLRAATPNNTVDTKKKFFTKPSRANRGRQQQ